MQMSWYMHRLKGDEPPGAVAPGDGAVETPVRRDVCRQSSQHPAGSPAAGVPALPVRDLAPGPLKARLAADASQLRAGHWHLFGWREVQVSQPPHWHRDPLGSLELPKDRLAHRLRSSRPARRGRCADGCGSSAVGRR